MGDMLRKAVHMRDMNWIPQPDVSCSERATRLSEDDEDTLRKAMGKKQLDVKKYGVIVENGRRRGLLLPDLAGVDTVEQQIDIARRKGNIGQREPLTLYRFEVQRHV